MRILILIMLIICAAGFQTRPSEKTQRLPVQRSQFKFQQLTKYEKRILRYNSTTGETVYYDPRPHIVVLNAKSGTYAFKWMGYDDKEKTVLVHRLDEIDSVISASVLRDSAGKRVYVYDIQNLPSSPTYVSSVAIQTFASDLKPINVSKQFAGTMSKNEDMKEGTWVRYGLPAFYNKADERVNPGRRVEIRLLSTAPPGLVECRLTAGDIGLNGAGEEMPEELEDLIPAYTGYSGWARGYTIGPVDKLRGISQKDQVSYLLSVLPQCSKQGWITDRAFRTYEQLLREKNLQSLFSRIGNDLRSDSITTEVFAMIDSMKG
jgi:hypothetical protein